MADDSYNFRGPRIYNVPPGTSQGPDWAVPLERSDALPQRTGRSQSPTIARRTSPALAGLTVTNDRSGPAALGHQLDQGYEEAQARPPTSLRSKMSVKDMAQHFLSADAAQSPALVRRPVDSPGRIVTSAITIPESPGFNKKLKDCPDLLWTWEKKNDDLNKMNDDLRMMNIDLGKKHEDLTKKHDDLSKRYESMKRVAQGFRDKYHVVKKDYEEIFRMCWKPHASAQGTSGIQQHKQFENVQPYQSRVSEQELGEDLPANDGNSEMTDSAKVRYLRKQPPSTASGQDVSPRDVWRRGSRFEANTDCAITSGIDQSHTRFQGWNQSSTRSEIPRNVVLELRVNLHLLPAITILSQTPLDKHSIENAHRIVRESMKIASAGRKQSPSTSEALLGRCWFYFGVCRVARTIIDGTDCRPEICFEKAAAKADGVYPEAQKAQRWRAEWQGHVLDAQARGDESRPVSSSSSASFWDGVKRLSGLSWAEKLERRTSIVDEETEVGSPRGERPEAKPRPQGFSRFFAGARVDLAGEDRHRTPRPGGLERIPTFSTMSGSTGSTEVSPTSATSQESLKLTKPERVPTFDSASSFDSQAPTPTDESFSPLGISPQHEGKGNFKLRQRLRLPLDKGFPTEPLNASRQSGGLAGATNGDVTIDIPAPESYGLGRDHIDLASAPESSSDISSRRTQSMACIEKPNDREYGIHDEDTTLPAPVTDRFKRHKSTASYIPPSFAGAGASSSTSGTISPVASAVASGSDTSASSVTSSSSSSGGSALLHHRGTSISNAISPLRALATGRANGSTLDSLREAEEGQSPYRSTFGEEVQRMEDAFSLELDGNRAGGGQSPGGGEGVETPKLLSNVHGHIA